MFDAKRYEAERALLSAKLPEDTWRFVGLDGKHPFLAMAVRTRLDSLYTIHIELERFPDQPPKVFVTKLLKDFEGNPLDERSSRMHIWDAENGHTRICHYGLDSWTPAVSLYKVYIKSALWLNVYEAHLKTGRPMDYYLKHQK